jgi:ElaB/YqjD/DUF883 family membrane-anchored ribosome-binding protein
VEPQNTTGAQQEVGNDPAAWAQDEYQKQSRDIAQAYESARREMNEALARLRTEIEQIDMAQATRRAQDWVESNPTLATFIAVGGGIALGRLLSSAVRSVPPPPPPLPVRVRDRALDYASIARDYAADIGEAIVAGAAIASGAIAAKASDAGGDIARRASGLSESVTDRVSEVTDGVRHRASDAARELQVDARDLSKTVKKKVSSGVDFGDTVVGAAKTVVAAILVKKVTDWIREMS